VVVAIVVVGIHALMAVEIHHVVVRAISIQGAPNKRWNRAADHAVVLCRFL